MAAALRQMAARAAFAAESLWRSRERLQEAGKRMAKAASAAVVELGGYSHWPERGMPSPRFNDPPNSSFQGTESKRAKARSEESSQMDGAGMAAGRSEADGHGPMGETCYGETGHLTHLEWGEDRTKELPALGAIAGLEMPDATVVQVEVASAKQSACCSIDSASPYTSGDECTHGHARERAWHAVPQSETEQTRAAGVEVEVVSSARSYVGSDTSKDSTSSGKDREPHQAHAASAPVLGAAVRLAEIGDPTRAATPPSPSSQSSEAISPIFEAGHNSIPIPIRPPALQPLPPSIFGSPRSRARTSPPAPHSTTMPQTPVRVPYQAVIYTSLDFSSPGVPPLSASHAVPLQDQPPLPVDSRAGYLPMPEPLVQQASPSAATPLEPLDSIGCESSDVPSCRDELSCRIRRSNDRDGTRSSFNQSPPAAALAFQKQSHPGNDISHSNSGLPSTTMSLDLEFEAWVAQRTPQSTEAVQGRCTATSAELLRRQGHASAGLADKRGDLSTSSSNSVKSTTTSAAAVHGPKSPLDTQFAVWVASVSRTTPIAHVGGSADEEVTPPFFSAGSSSDPVWYRAGSVCRGSSVATGARRSLYYGEESDNNSKWW